MAGRPGDNSSRLLGRGCALLLLSSLLAACGGGGASGGDVVTVASGQAPDPVVVDVPVAYVKRTVSSEDAADDARRLLPARGGAGIFLRLRAAPSAPEFDLTPGLGEGSFDIRDLDVSFDGERILFAARGPLDDPELAEETTWNLWEYDRIAETLRRVIASDTIAESGHDRFGSYLPDGRIVFSSTRAQRARAVLLDEGKPQFEALDGDRAEPIFALHVMRADGSDIRQLTFGTDHDLAPRVADDGRVLFARRGRSVNDGIRLYRVNPDGTGLELLYGALSHEDPAREREVSFLEPHPVDGGALVLLRELVSRDAGGDIVFVDVENFVEREQALADAPAPVPPAERAATTNVVLLGDGLSPGGRYRGFWPLEGRADGRMFVLWSLCRAVRDAGPIVPCPAADDPSVPEQETLAPAAPLFGLYLFDPAQDTLTPVLAPQEGVAFSAVVAAQPRPVPTIRFDAADDGRADRLLLEQGVGELAIRSIHDVSGTDLAPGGIDALADPAQTTAAMREARFLRITRPVAQPDRDVRAVPGSAFGPRGRRVGMREILGYAPIEPDGSVILRAPADVPLSLSVVDVRGRRIGERHSATLQLRAGESRSCNGCHDPSTGTSHGRDGAFASAHDGAPADGQFPNTVAAFVGEAGESMAQQRKRVSCATDCASTRPSSGLVYADPWTDEARAGRAPDAERVVRYASLATPAPLPMSCGDAWTPRCRAVIHYETHVHPLWSLPRLITDPADPAVVLRDDTCTACHGPTSADGLVRVPAGDLDLTDGPSADVPAQFNAYRELVAGRVERIVDGGVLVPRLVEDGVDPDTGEPILRTVPLPRVLLAGRARASSRFFDRFDAGGDHAGYLSEFELRLLSEWVDIGAQYFNDPFAVEAD